MKYQQICFEESHNSHQSDNCPEQHSVVPTQSIYRVGALNWSILVFVRLAGNGVGAFDAKYGVMDGMEAENEEKYSAANWTTSSGFLSNRNWRKSANRFFSSGCERMYVVWSPFNSSWKQQRWCTFTYSSIWTRYWQKNLFPKNQWKYFVIVGEKSSLNRESNPGPLTYRTSAWTTELLRPDIYPERQTYIRWHISRPQSWTRSG